MTPATLVYSGRPRTPHVGYGWVTIIERLFSESLFPGAGMTQCPSLGGFNIRGTEAHVKVGAGRAPPGVPVAGR